MSATLSLTAVRMRLALRNRAFIFFSVIMPLGFLFFFFLVFGRGGPIAVQYLLAAVLALSVMGSFWGLSVQLISFREQGVLRRFRLTPIGPGPLLASSILSNYMLTIPTVIIEYVAARWLFGMQHWGNLPSAIVLVTVGSASFSALGLIVASVTNSLQETQVINNILWSIFFFLSGATIPLPVFPIWIQHAAFYLPATYLVSGLERALVMNTGLVGTAPDTFALVASVIVAFEVSRRLFRWEPEEKVSSRAKVWVLVAVIPFLIMGAVESHSKRQVVQMQQIFHAIAPNGLSFTGPGPTH
ncbi:MAG TPA: ABC transporter permease [Candidatus Dormibacteraeota bacterium]|nr:ABC transporter permease [Candidatus Dormibacteraeota bacterium]